MSTDALSDVLSAVQLSGSVFFDVTAKSPWVAEAPPAARIADDVMPGAQHVIEYHVVTRGTCWISLVGDTAFEPVKLDEGDIAVIPQGDPHVVSSAPGMRAEPNWEAHRRPEDANALPFPTRVRSIRCSIRYRGSCGLAVTHREGHTVCSINLSNSLPPRPATNGRAARVFSTDFRN